MARHKFNINQKRDRHGRWTSSGSSAGSKVGSRASRVGTGAKNFGKFLVTPRAPAGSGARNQATLTKKKATIHLAIALAPLVLPAAFAGIGKLDELIQVSTHNKINSNNARYDAARRAATFGVKVAKTAPSKFSKKNGGVYNISSMSGRKV